MSVVETYGQPSGVGVRLPFREGLRDDFVLLQSYWFFSLAVEGSANTKETRSMQSLVDKDGALTN